MELTAPAGDTHPMKAEAGCTLEKVECIVAGSRIAGGSDMKGRLAGGGE